MINLTKSSQFTSDSLSKTLEALGATKSVSLFELLKKLHTEPGRYYHTDQHISECLSHFRQVQSLAHRPCEIEIAFWFHDAVYDTRSNDNEEKSAALAEKHLLSINTADDVVKRISQMILATKSRDPKSTDEELLVDIDLGILGSPEESFERYDTAIRSEYSCVPEQHYRSARADVLEGFLRRNRIYHTEIIHDALESQARNNLRS